jgi:hypothetical protein
MGEATVNVGIGGTAHVQGLADTFSVADTAGGTPADVTLEGIGSQWFDYTSSDTNVATVDADGLATAVGVGTAHITATCGTINVGGQLNVVVNGNPTEPPDAAPIPAFAAGDVISIFSSHYDDVTVNTLRAGFSQADQTTFDVGGTTVLKYTLHNFVGIEFVGNGDVDHPINATDAGMTHFSMTVWTTDVDTLLIKVIDFGADASFAGGDDTEIDEDKSIPTKGDWVVLDFPLSDNPGLNAAHISQVILDGHSTAGNTVFIDHMIFHK